MDCNSKLFNELKLLHSIILNENKKLKSRLENSESDVDLSDLDSVTFGQLVYTISKSLTPKMLMDISDEQMILHIQKLQIKERE